MLTKLIALIILLLLTCTINGMFRLNNIADLDTIPHIFAPSSTKSTSPHIILEWGALGLEGKEGSSSQLADSSIQLLNAYNVAILSPSAIHAPQFSGSIIYYNDQSPKEAVLLWLRSFQSLTRVAFIGRSLDEVLSAHSICASDRRVQEYYGIVMTPNHKP